MAEIKLLVMDVDGTLTDGRIYMNAHGEAMKAFDVKDGYAIANILPELKILPVIITGRKSEIVEKRAQELKIVEIYQGVTDKLGKLKDVIAEHGLSAMEVAYIGDDLNDLDCIHYCGYSASPADAVYEVLKDVDYVCTHPGGRGAVREFIEHLKRTKLEDML